jgi:RNA polymerase sigma-70 factor (ECF subfamily)
MEKYSYFCKNPGETLHRRERSKGVYGDMPQSDHEIIETIRKGSPHNYALLVHRYKERGMTLALRMLRNREEAEEVLQDAFVRAYNGLEKFKGMAKFGTWFYRILYNACLTRLERNKHAAVAFLDDAEPDEAMHPDGGEPELIDALDRKDLIRQVKEIVESLPEMYGALLTMFYLQELTYEEIAGVTQMPLGTVKVRLFRGRAMLQSRLLREASGARSAT